MKSKTLYLLLCCLFCLTANAQLNQRFDNINYKAIYFKDASKLIKTTPGLLLLDVRSPGEFADTSRFESLNIGHLKGAVNISIDSIKNHLKDLKAYKDKPILVYCSHSQRSRVVSKLLTDSGFTNVSSLNGGMSLVNDSNDDDFPVKSSLYETTVPYKLLQYQDAYNFIRNKNNVIIDLRPASQFNSADSAEDNNIGRIKGAINVPAKQFDEKINELAKYKNRPVMLYDLHNSESIGAALKLKKAGFGNVNVLFEGLGSLMVNTPSAAGLRDELFTGRPKYKIVGSKEAIGLVNKYPDLLIADVRPVSVFANKSDKLFLRLGHIKNAVNLTDEAQFNDCLKDKPKSTPILVYGMGMSGMRSMMGTTPLLNESMVCKQLAAKGYTNVYLVYNGLYSVVWSVTNVEDCKNGMAILADHAGLY